MLTLCITAGPCCDTDTPAAASCPTAATDPATTTTDTAADVSQRPADQAVRAEPGRPVCQPHATTTGTREICFHVPQHFWVEGANR